MKLLPQMKKFAPFLKEADSIALQYACECVDNAYKNFFSKNAKYPKFKKKRSEQSYTTKSVNGNIVIGDNKLSFISSVG